jgi:hypothetical protein
MTIFAGALYKGIERSFMLLLNRVGIVHGIEEERQVIRVR